MILQTGIIVESINVKVVSPGDSEGSCELDPWGVLRAPMKLWDCYPLYVVLAGAGLFFLLGIFCYCCCCKNCCGGSKKGSNRYAQQLDNPFAKSYVNKEVREQELARFRNISETSSSAYQTPTPTISRSGLSSRMEGIGSSPRSSRLGAQGKKAKAPKIPKKGKKAQENSEILARFERITGAETI